MSRLDIRFGDSLRESRDGLHQIAFFALGPARYHAVGRMGLQPYPGGFGTPEYEGKIARIDGDLLVLEESEVAATQAITTVREAAEFFGVEYQVDWFADFHDPLEPADPDEAVEVDPFVTRALGEWYRFGWSSLERLSSRATLEDDASGVQLWPEHLDAAAELGNSGEGRRASFGVSPGDDGHPDPYIYVAAWGDVDRSNPYWNDESFNGSSLSLDDLRSQPDPESAAVDFFMAGYQILHS